MVTATKPKFGVDNLPSLGADRCLIDIGERTNIYATLDVVERDVMGLCSFAHERLEMLAAIEAILFGLIKGHFSGGKRDCGLLLRWVISGDSDAPPKS